MEPEFRVWVLDDNPANLRMIDAASRRPYGPRLRCGRSTTPETSWRPSTRCAGPTWNASPISSCWITSWGRMYGSQVSTTC